jgi:hypothetical protein
MSRHTRKPWNRCDVCGVFIGLAEFESGTAVRRMATPDTAFSSETYATYHLDCRNTERRKLAAIAKAEGRTP